MKFLPTYLLALAFTLAYAQKTKTETFNVQYEKFASKNIDPTFSYYQSRVIELPDGVYHKDSIDINNLVACKRAFVASEFQLINSILFPGLKKANLTEADIQISLYYELPQLISKELNIDKNFAPIQGGDPIEGAYTYKLTFYLPYKLIIKDKAGKEIYRDSSNNNHKIISFFPNQGNRSYAHFGLASQSFLDTQWKKLSESFLRNEALHNLNGEIDLINANLDEIFKSGSKEFISFKYYYLSKKDKYADLDSALNLFNTIFDTVKANFKSQNHKNWHCVSIKKNAGQCYSILNKALNEFVSDSKANRTDGRFNVEFAQLLIVDECLAEWLGGNYNKSLNELKLMVDKSDLNNINRDFYLEKLYEFIKNDKLVFENNKLKYSW